MKWVVGLALMALLAGCSSDAVRVDPGPPRTVTVTKTVEAEPTKQPRPPRPPDPANISCNDSGEAVDEFGLLGFRLWLVTRVVNGDTVEVRGSCGSGRITTIQFIGTDTPEPVQCYGPEASRFTTQWLQGRLVKLEFDKDRIDPYGRTLAYVVTETGDMFNTLLVRWGFATVATYPPNTRHVREFKRAERRAREQDIGLWGAC